MLAKFKNGYFLEAVMQEQESCENPTMNAEIDFSIYDSHGDELRSGWSELRKDLSLYDCENEIAYILRYCMDSFSLHLLKGGYQVCKESTMEDFIENRESQFDDAFLVSHGAKIGAEIVLKSSLVEKIGAAKEQAGMPNKSKVLESEREDIGRT